MIEPTTYRYFYAGIRSVSALLTLLVSMVHASPPQSDFRILASDRDGIVVEFVPSFYPAGSVNINGSVYEVVDFAGAIKSAERPGFPDLRQRSLLVALPGGIGNSVDIIGTEYENIQGISLTPVPDIIEGDVAPVRTFRVDPEAYARSGFEPRTIAVLSRIGPSRGRYFGDLEITPLQYDAASRMLRKYTRIVVRVNFGGREGALTPADVLSQGIAINDEVTPVGKFAPEATRIPAARNSVLSSGAWYRFTVVEDAVYRITGQQLLDAGVPASTDPATIKIFGNGGYQTPLDVEAPFVDDLLENAVYLNDDVNPGSLNAADYLLFYGRGVRGWRYDPAARSFSHSLNHYTETNVYWLTFGNLTARRMAGIPSAGGVPGSRPVTTVAKLFREDEKINLLGSGIQWLGQAFLPGDQMIYVHPLPGLDVTRPIRYRFHVGARSGGTSTFTVDEHAMRILTKSLSSTPVGSYFLKQFVDTSPSNPEAISEVSSTPAFTEEQSQLRFRFTSTSSSGNGYIDWYEIYYHRLLRAQGDVYAFHTPDTTAVLEYAVRGFSSRPVLVFDVTKFDSVALITGARVSGDTCTFRIAVEAGLPKEICIAGSGAWKSIGALTRAGNQNLHGRTEPAEYVIITHADFRSAADRLKAHRERPGADYLKTLVIDVNEIYNEFGGGLFTPVAIRNYLRYVSQIWPGPPKYALLLGDGDYDYKRILSQSPLWIPPWETPESFTPISSYASDDDFVTFNTSRRVDIGLGRLTARSAQEANIMIDKIIEYETLPVNDPWKMRVTLVADDGLAAPGEDNGFIHTSQSESISSLAPTLFEKRKLYLFDYPTVFTSGGRRKPGVNTALVNQINEGSLILNFTGHGNPRLWAHEQVFVRENEFPLLKNRGKYFILVAATCNFSQFDLLNEQSGGEILVAMPDGGAIGVFSATRAVLSFENFALNQTLYQNLFQIGPSGRITPQRFGDVLYRTKQIRTSENDRKYFFLGDPALRVAFPAMYASVDSINGLPATKQVQLQALSRSSVNATVRDTLTGNPIGFTGTAEVVVYDADRTVRISDPKFGQFTYKTAGSILFRGKQSIMDGTISARFIVPKDIANSDNLGRITVYFWNETADGAGYTSTIRVGGIDTTAAPDDEGPSMTIYLDGRIVRPGDIVGTGPLLTLELADSSGINTSGSGVGHRLEAWLNESRESIDLSSYYESKINTFREGFVRYRLADVRDGSNRLKVRAWDTYNNSSVEEIVFDVATGVGLLLSNVVNYPNPFGASTVFTFEHNQVTQVNAEVKIYTVAGRLIQSLRASNVTEQFVRIPWDGRDRDGDLPSNGVYLYKIIVTTPDGRHGSEATGKMSIQR